MGQIYLAEPQTDGDEARTLRPLQAAAITYRIAFGPRAGHKVLTLRGAMAREGMARQPLCVDIGGSAFTRPCRLKYTMARDWSECAAPSPARLCSTTGHSSTPRGR